jgi:hypothetical protein
MAQWIIRVTSTRQKEVDKHLLAQAVLALGRYLQKQELSKLKKDPHCTPKEASST